MDTGVYQGHLDSPGLSCVVLGVKGVTLDIVLGEKVVAFAGSFLL